MLIHTARNCGTGRLVFGRTAALWLVTKTFFFSDNSKKRGLSRSFFRPCHHQHHFCQQRSLSRHVCRSIWHKCQGTTSRSSTHTLFVTLLWWSDTLTRRTKHSPVKGEGRQESVGNIPPTKVIVGIDSLTFLFE